MIAIATEKEVAEALHKVGLTADLFQEQVKQVFIFLPNHVPSPFVVTYEFKFWKFSAHSSVIYSPLVATFFFVYRVTCFARGTKWLTKC